MRNAGAGHVAAGTRVTADGKSFLLEGSSFRFRGLRHEPEPTDPLVGQNHRLHLGRMAGAGYTVVSMPPPPRGAIGEATASGLRFMLELNCPSLDGLAARSRRERKRLVREAAMRVRRAVEPWSGSEALLGIAFECPAALGRSDLGTGVVRQAADELAICLHDEESSLLAAWRDCWPLERGCPSEFDFVIVEFELANRDELAPAIIASHCEVGDRPLVVGSVSLRASEECGASDVAWVMDNALRCGAGGTIAECRARGKGTDGDSEMARVNRQTVRDLDVNWPSISVVVNAHNAESTLDECLSHCDALEYPQLEVIVIDDGSTDATPAIARAHPRAQLVTIPRRGLSEGRNVGYRSASGGLIAYLDADAYPSPDWLWYIALAALGDGIAGSGGPNIPALYEPVQARVVARSPGGPVPELRGPDRAKHVPGCNMAFWRQVLEELHGFDPVLESTEDVEFEWRVVESGREIAYHPAALVWHHPRPGLRPYLRQQRHYGRGQAIVERRYPERFPRGYRLRNAVKRLRVRPSDATGERRYRVRYLSLPGDEGAVLELAHQWGIPAAIVLGFTAPLGLARRRLAVPALFAGAFVGALFGIDVLAAGEERRRSERTLAFRASVAACRLLRPLAFRWGHLTEWFALRGTTPCWPPRPDEVSEEVPPGAPARAHA
jgi:glycosyltransferase involved in cell wall biosynthesis